MELKNRFSNVFCAFAPVHYLRWPSGIAFHMQLVSCLHLTVSLDAGRACLRLRLTRFGDLADLQLPQDSGTTQSMCPMCQVLEGSDDDLSPTGKTEFFEGIDWYCAAPQVILRGGWGMMG